jgi:heat shock protein HslJ
MSSKNDKALPKGSSNSYMTARPTSRSLVPDPEKHTLVLRSDGTYQVKADCNSTAGDYVLEGNRLTLLAGSAMLAECEAGSLYDEYLAFLGQVVTFELEGEKLVLSLKEGTGKMGFVKGAAKPRSSTSPGSGWN